jgi:hypothetical protein
MASTTVRRIDFFYHYDSNFQLKKYALDCFFYIISSVLIAAQAPGSDALRARLEGKEHNMRDLSTLTATELRAEIAQCEADLAIVETAGSLRATNVVKKRLWAAVDALFTVHGQLV